MNREPSDENAIPAPFRQEPDSFNTPKVITIGVVTLIIFTIGCLWAANIYRTQTFAVNPHGYSPAPALGQREIGIVDQVPFEQMREPAQVRAAARERLEGYGWVDRKAGVVHIPIERAFDQLLAEQKGGGK